MNNKIQVIVGNLGTVYSGDDMDAAQEVYDEYIRRSDEGIGRVADEDVAMMVDGSVQHEYFGSRSLAGYS